MTPTREQKANVALWLAALRSGEYKQTHTHLHDESGYCCLGVACALYQMREGGDPLNVREHKDMYGTIIYEYDHNDQTLPDRVVEWLGLDTRDGKFTASPPDAFGDEYALAAANDFGATFAEIADFIESNPAGLFATDAD